MSASSPEPGSRSGPPAVGPAVLAATVLVVVLATWAAAIGPDRVFGGDGASEDTSSELPDTEQFATEPPAAEAEEEDDEGGGSAALIALEIAIVLAIIYLLFLVFRWVRLDPKPAERWRKRRRRQRVEFEVLPATPEQAAEAMVRDADQQLALLLEGSPRNGIVACWHRFEVQAETAGFGREPWETSAEFTLRVLDVVSADEPAVSELSVLYREARFSDHELAESARASAVDALARIHRSLGARHTTGMS